MMFYMKFLRFFLTILLSALFSSLPAFADTTAPSELQTLIDGFQIQGVTFKQSEDKKDVEIDIDQNKTLAAIPDLQKAGIVNADISQTAINFNPALFAVLVGQSFIVAYLDKLYEDTDVDSVHFNAYLLSPNDYGNLDKHRVFSFSFNRALYKRIDWDNFNVANLVKVALNFHYSRWFMENAQNDY